MTLLFHALSIAMSNISINPFYVDPSLLVYKNDQQYNDCMIRLFNRYATVTYISAPDDVSYDWRFVGTCVNAESLPCYEFIYVHYPFLGNGIVKTNVKVPIGLFQRGVKQINWELKLENDHVSLIPLRTYLNKISEA